MVRAVVAGAMMVTGWWERDAIRGAVTRTVRSWLQGAGYS